MPIHGRGLPKYPPSVMISKRGRQLGTILDQLGRVSGPRGSQYGPMGPQIGHTRILEAFPGVAMVDFAVRTGTTCSVGQVTMYQSQGSWDASTPPNLTSAQVISTPRLVWCYCPVGVAQSSGNAIDAGQTVWVEQDIWGNYAVAPMDFA